LYLKYPIYFFYPIKNIKGISKNTPFPLQWRGIKGEAKQIIRVFRDALKLIAGQALMDTGFSVLKEAL